MAEMRLVDRFGPLVGPTTVGAVVALIGTGLLFFYPLTVGGLVPGTKQFGSEAMRATHPFVLYLSAIVGPIAMIWGIFASLDDDYTPLTPRREFVVLGPAVVSICSGVSWFVFRWAGETPIGIHGQTTRTITHIQALHHELNAIQLIVLAAVSATIVGTVAATRDRRTALAATALPIGLTAIGILWNPNLLRLPGFIFIVPLLAIPFAVGYTAARTA